MILILIRLLEDMLKKCPCSKVNICTSMSTGFLCLFLWHVFIPMVIFTFVMSREDRKLHLVRHTGQQCVGTYQCLLCPRLKVQNENKPPFPLGSAASPSPKLETLRCSCAERTECSRSACNQAVGQVGKFNGHQLGPVEGTSGASGKFTINGKPCCVW